ncbi:MAG TPA: MarR family transcriptional regulator [Terriglobales bacterium]|nr:MarR family transcriptional regulator [Terriglobales bacterium]
MADRLHSAAIRLLRRLRAQDRAAGIGPAQLSALSVLVFGGPCSLKQLAEAEQVRPPTMSRIAAGLRRAGLVRAEAVGADRRKLRLVPTAKGIQVMQQGRRRRVQQLARALRTFPENKVRRLGHAAETIFELVRRL